MIIAVLFNSDDPSLGGCYGDEVEKKIFNTKVLQQADRHMKIGCGDVLFASHTKTFYDIVIHAEETFFHFECKRLFKRKIYDCVQTSTVYAWVIQNVTEAIADELHSKLADFPSYLGIHPVNFAYRFHLGYYLLSIGEKYRLKGNSIRILCPMNEGVDCDCTAEINELKELGFTDVAVEDSGARLTIFDDYNTIEHYEQINDIIKIISPCFRGGEPDAYELVMYLSDSDPRLFNALGSAVRAIPQIRNEEDAAHVAVSGRRYLEQLANALFPPKQEKVNGRKVGKAEYKNRIWAFIEERCKGEKDRVEKLGQEVDRLNELFCKGVHGSLTKEETIKAFTDLAVLSLTLLSLQPMYAGNPYFAYNDGLQAFLNKIISREDI